MRKIMICGKSECCPKVEIYDEEVKIGEGGNFCVLKKHQWKSLVEKIKSGELY
ncbi:unnamed protein product [marine sediment metagenome]|uniref:DUF397 domain-containing protein n=1 Tax=marine sediment metagenome TaxID=412755 RepID=X1ST41_9ZZZZ